MPKPHVRFAGHGLEASTPVTLPPVFNTVTVPVVPVVTARMPVLPVTAPELATLTLPAPVAIMPYRGGSIVAEFTTVTFPVPKFCAKIPALVKLPYPAPLLSTWILPEFTIVMNPAVVFPDALMPAVLVPLPAPTAPIWPELTITIEPLVDVDRRP